MPTALALPTTSVFMDFDGTVAVADTGVHILERLGRDGWQTIDADYGAGLLGSRETLSREWQLVEGGIEAARSVAREVAIDEGFAPLVEALRAAGAEVTVVSDGFGFYATEVCAAIGVDVLTNAVDGGGDLAFPFSDRCCPCSSCGVCKQAPIKEARRRGQSTVLIGDGVSDRKAALLADLVYAKSDLADWCDEVGVDYRPYARLADVHRTLVR